MKKLGLLLLLSGMVGGSCFAMAPSGEMTEAEYRSRKLALLARSVTAQEMSATAQQVLALVAERKCESRVVTSPDHLAIVEARDAAVQKLLDMSKDNSSDNS